MYIKATSSIEDVLRVVEANSIEFIRIEFLDYSNVTRARTIRKKNFHLVLLIKIPCH